MQPDPALAFWLRLTLIPGVGSETQRRLLRVLGPPEAIFSTDRRVLCDVIGDRLTYTLLETDNSQAVAAACAWAAQDDNAVITLGSPAYPSMLLEIADPPILLYAKGRLELLNQPILAVVGSRNPTPQGIQNAEMFSRALANAGLTIASGLALGIDAAAHRATLAAEGNTVAFVGTGADRIYPATNRELAIRIGDRGCIVSEFPLGTPAIASNFPRRNRLISGIALGTLVVEATESSGSLITARFAADQGRDVFVIPGSIHSPQSRGCHKLIKQGAKLVETTQDIFEELCWPHTSRPSESPSPALPAAGPDALLEQIGFDPCSIDSLAERTGLTVNTLSPRLLQLELEGHLASLPGGNVQRIKPR